MEETEEFTTALTPGTEQQPDFDALLSANRDYQSAFDRRVGKALQTARTNWEREQEQSLETRREEAYAQGLARAQEEYRLRSEALTGREQECEARMRSMALTQELLQRGLPADFAPWLLTGSESESLQRLERFESAFRAAVSDAVGARMAGAAPEAPALPRTYDREALRTMPPDEINAHWDEIRSSLMRG